MQGEALVKRGGCSPAHKWMGRPLTEQDHGEAKCGLPFEQVGAFGGMYAFGRYDTHTLPCAYSQQGLQQEQGQTQLVACGSFTM